MSNNKNEEAETSKDLCVTSNSNRACQFIFYEPRKHQSEQRRRSEEEEKRFMSKFKVDIKNPEEARFNANQQEGKMITFPQSSNTEATLSISLETNTRKTDSPSAELVFAESVFNPVSTSDEFVPSQNNVSTMPPMYQVNNLFNFVSHSGQIYEDSHLFLPEDYYSDNVMSNQLVYEDGQLLLPEDYYNNNFMYIL
ncbi:11265_t:CDS:2 [Dentiscutata erythropus]|uniref:11265_t:CDS:1 n=1 Tax=Dentiscutata erythropus TaxID=1348616 RepID=A0A9N9IYZ9_9GLOM|nr:11265_t:CDS:2 [Dentiscutata erythropus]